MTSRRTLVMALSAIGPLTCIVLPARASGVSAQSATAVTRVFGNGLRFVAVAITFSGDVKARDLSPSAFHVAGRTVTTVYPAASADPRDRAEQGPVVIVELAETDTGAVLSVQPPHVAPSAASVMAQGRTPGGPSAAGGPPGGRPNWKVGQRQVSDLTWREPQATVVVDALHLGDGSRVAAVQLATTAVRNPILDDFQQRVWHDPLTGRTLPYNLYVPSGYDPKRSYPLVNFMHDAGTCSDDPLMTLKQGLGAVVWASPEDQAKRPCFVLAPQFAEIVADNKDQTSDMLDTTIHLIQALCREFSIDPQRLYTTGQSGGGMLSMAMNIKYPTFFAASLLVACQWGPEHVAPMAGSRLFIITSEDDPGAFPGQNADTAALERAGATVARATWDATWNAAQFQRAFDELDARAARINYVVFAKGTVLPPGTSANERAAGHMNTWRVAYAIEPVREWIFRTVPPARLPAG